MGDFKEKFHYDAFISYRHLEPDRFVAENLHRELEHYRLPANVEKALKQKDPDAKTRITRVFRDEEELPLASNLEDPIIEALKNSEYLIVICSKKLKESLWCRKEIETFVAMHGVDRVLTILVEGEPEDSFPEELLSREVEVTDEDGHTRLVREKIEPLAADVRADNNKDRLKMIRKELLRLLAAMYGLNYDDLRQRHREQIFRRRITLAGIAAVLMFLFGAMGTYYAVNMRRQRDEIAAQADKILEQSVKIQTQSVELQSQAQSLEERNKELLIYQAKTLANDSMEYLEQDERKAAIRSAYDALTEYGGNVMPYTDEARYALGQALNLYCASQKVRAARSIELSAGVEVVRVSPSGEIVMVFDTSDRISFWTVRDGKRIGIVENACDSFDAQKMLFIDDKTFLYCDNQMIWRVEPEGGKREVFYELEEFSVFGFHTLCYDAEEGLLYANISEKILQLDAVSGECRNTFPVEFASYVAGDYMKLLDSGILGVLTGEKLYVMNSKGEILFQCDMDGDQLEDLILCNGNLYLLCYGQDTAAEVIDLFSNVTKLKGYEMQSSRKLFEKTENDIYGHSLCSIEEEDGVQIVEIGSYGIIEYDPITGEEKKKSIHNEGILWYGQEQTYVDYITGDYAFMTLKGYLTSGMKNIMDCHFDKVDIVEMIADGVLVHEDSSDRLVVYESMVNPDLESYSGSYEPAECEALIYGDAVDAAREMGIVNATFVSGVCYDPAKKKACVSYKDGKADVIRLEDKTVECSFDTGNSYKTISQYMGKDAEGNEYWANDSEGYCLSPQGNVIAGIELLRGVDMENGQYILGYATDGAERYCMPVYTLEDMLQKAEEWLK